LTIGKKSLLSSNTSSTCLHNMVNFGPLMAEIDLLVLGTPSYFNGYRVFISGRQANFAALNRGRHLYSAERSSRWALAHISSALSLLCPQEGCNVLQSACLSVCLSVWLHVSNKFLWMLSVAVARSCSEDSTVHYVLPV